MATRNLLRLFLLASLTSLQAAVFGLTIWASCCLAKCFGWTNRLTGKPLKICHLQYCTIFYYVCIYIYNIHIIYVIYIYVYYTHIWIWHCKWWIPKKEGGPSQVLTAMFSAGHGNTAGLQGILSSPCNEWRGFTLQPPEILGHNAGKGQISYHQFGCPQLSCNWIVGC